MALLSKRSGNGEHEDSGATGDRSPPDAPAGTDGREKPVADEPAAGQHADPPAAKPSRSTSPPTSPPTRRSRAGRAQGRGRDPPSGERSQVRTRLAQVVWLLFVVAALFLAVGALCIALGANKDNGAVSFVLDGAKFFDLDIFSRSNGIKTFGGDNAATKNALFNWGIGAVAVPRRRPDPGAHHPALSRACDRSHRRERFSCRCTR